MDGNLKSAALVELTIGDKKIIGLGTKVDWGFSNASSDIKHGVGGFKSGRVAHDILYHFDISFNVFDTSNYENGNFSLQELVIGGGSQLRISKDSPNLNSSPEIAKVFGISKTTPGGSHFCFHFKTFFAYHPPPRTGGR